MAGIGFAVLAVSFVAIFVNDPHHGQVDLVHLETRLVVELLGQVAFPLRTGNGIEATVLKALKALFARL